MKNRKMLLPFLLSMALVFSLILPVSMLNTAPVMAQGQVAPMVAADTMVSAGDYSPPECEVGDWADIDQVSAGEYHTVGLKADGTVVAVGSSGGSWNDYGQCNVSGWENITEVAADEHTVGLRKDGTVFAVGYNGDGQCDVGGWTGVNQTAAGGHHTVGLKSDGTVVAVGGGYYDIGQCDVGSWTNTTQVTAGGLHTVGLKSDGTVVAVGWNEYGQCNVNNWTDIDQVAAGHAHTVGLKSDGTVVAVGYDHFGQCDVGGWADISRIAAGDHYTLGLKSDGTVVAVGNNGSGQCDVEGWVDIIQVACGRWHTVGLKSDGAVVAVGGFVLEEMPHGGFNGCFIATAAYGTPMAGEIEILREFRDEYLLTNSLGQALVGLYYRVSPSIAEFITEHPSLKPIVRAGLLPAVAMSAIAVNTTPAEKIAILGLLALVSAALVVWVTRWWGRDPQYT